MESLKPAGHMLSESVFKGNEETGRIMPPYYKVHHITVYGDENFTYASSRILDLVKADLQKSHNRLTYDELIEDPKFYEDIKSGLPF